MTRLIQSSERSWTSDSTDIQPDFDAYGPLGFPRGEDQGRKVLAVAVEGRFQSPFAGKPSPLLEAKDDEKSDEAADPEAAEAEEEDEAAEDEKKPVISGVIESSPGSARLILIGSSAFVTDTAISLATEATQTRYMKPIELIQNAVEWSLEDRGLLGPARPWPVQPAPGAAGPGGADVLRVSELCSGPGRTGAPVLAGQTRPDAARQDPGPVS